MRDPNRIDEFLDKLKEYWKQIPDWRFGQLIENVMRFANVDWPNRLFFIEDNDFIHYMNEFFERSDE